ncbi:alkane hydroxylase MAH1-like [Andrographis paniculata]|uniref:alkane hydroxylase MAH1-like n=1 Tax=Andrographis paniculata TaxID=175694 RepID=UPI0021E8B996|nr:alkane hydroxylase MAH1-like [Andrographis paniculata]
MAILDWIEVFVMIPAIVFLFRWADRRGKKRSEPTTWPAIGMLPAAIQNFRRQHDYITEVLTDSGGTFEFKGPPFCNVDMVFTCDPANIHHIFSKNFSNYPKGPEFRKIFDILGDGIFNADFELWEVHRRTTQFLLTGAGFHRALEKTVWGKVETGLLPVLDNFYNNGADVDLQEIFQRFAFDNVCKIVLDYDPRSLCVQWPFIPCEKAFSVALEPLFYRHIIPEPVWKLQKWLKIGREKKLMESSYNFDQFIYSQIDKKKDSKFLTAFEKTYESVGSSRCLRDFLKDTSLNLMFAGRDTTSTCLTWLFYLIAQNPNSQTKILEEIKSQLQIHGGEQFRFFGAEESGKLLYLHGALCESLRLFPPVALEHKAPVRPDVLPSGHRVSRDAKIIVSFYSVGRMASVWGEDCLEFKPERWISTAGGGGIKHAPSYKFPAFNAGARTCLGKEMAFIQMKMVAAWLVYRYRIELVGGHRVFPRDSIILQAVNGLRVRLFRRGDDD